MSVAFLHPVLDAMKGLGCGDETLARQLKIPTPDMQDASTLLPASRIYGFLQWSSEQTGDPWLCARIGLSMALDGWQPMSQLFRDSRTVWEFFRRFSILAANQGGAAIYRLEVEGRIALWRLTRPKGAPDSARYADAMAVGFFVGILRQAGNEALDQSACIAVTSDVALVPGDILPNANVMHGALGVTLRFPSDWTDWNLSAPASPENMKHPGLPDVGVVDLKSRVLKIIDQHLADTSFGVEAIADALGMKQWKLQRGLRTVNTSIAELRNEARLARARELLRSDGTSVSEIAASLGYTSSSNFSRAFRTRTGVSPSDFRKN